ncbi:MAG: ChaN family lipoprotein [Bacteroidales bacterium]|nr:ChaN family lipoprotein [Bacteroidales bacterium]MCF8455114.1 ChaN family lipoprotein [Bacteroidales bacterium]
MKTNTILLVLTAMLSFAFKSDKPAYMLYTKDGKEVKFEKMINELKDADVVFFGEQHNNPIAHWLQFELTKSLYDLKKEKLQLGAEMFETDNQLILDEYLDGIISEKKFEAEARLWPNYQTDYKPLVNFAKEHQLTFVASNIPRRYASLVFTDGLEGLDKLSDEAKKYVAELPIKYNPELDCYKNMLGTSESSPMHQSDNLPKAQAVKDATMAQSILKYWKDGQLFLHFNGSYHSDNHESILWYLKQANPKLKIMTITTVEQENVEELADDEKGVADYIICVPETMTKTR